jgi:hypothetical protein
LVEFPYGRKPYGHLLAVGCDHVFGVREHPVDRAFSWIDQNRRMSKDYERFLCASGEALVYAAMSRLMTRRLARV